MISNFEIVMRLILASVIGGFIGLERESSNRPAGFRTHVLVSLGSALVMLVSRDGFIIDGIRYGDPARLAAQVISGIGFLGAGTIMKTGDSISGLTTAASLWVSAGLGLAIGSGYYLGGIVAGFIVLLTLSNLGALERRINRHKYKTVKITAVNVPGIIGAIGVLFGKYQVSIIDIVIFNERQIKEKEIFDMKLVLRVPNDLKLGKLFDEVNKLEGVEALVYEGKIIFDGNREENMI